MVRLEGMSLWLLLGSCSPIFIKGSTQTGPPPGQG